LDAPAEKEYVPMTELPQGARDLLDGPNFAHMATLMADGSPHVIAIWAGRDGDRVMTYTGGADSLKARNLRRDPRVSISMVAQDNPYKKMHLRGRVVEFRTGPEARAVMDGFGVKYTGKPFPFPTPDGVLFVIEPERVTYNELPFEHAPG
jgi:PPOX class probable F420-dependent enzyme